MDTDEINLALRGIEQMVLVSIQAQNFLGNDTDTDTECLQLRHGDIEMLSFATQDLLKRIKELRAGLYPPASAPIASAAM